MPKYQATSYIRLSYTDDPLQRERQRYQSAKAD